MTELEQLLQDTIDFLEEEAALRERYAKRRNNAYSRRAMVRMMKCRSLAESLRKHVQTSPKSRARPK